MHIRGTLKVARGGELQLSCMSKEKTTALGAMANSVVPVLFYL
jgi:hypothetical protein